jgi:hypothetical protein
MPCHAMPCRAIPCHDMPVPVPVPWPWPCRAKLSLPPCRHWQLPRCGSAMCAHALAPLVAFGMLVLIAHGYGGDSPRYMGLDPVC